MFWISHVLILGGLVFFLSGDEEVDWQKLILMVALLIIPAGVISNLIFGNGIGKTLVVFAAVFAGVAFVLKIPPKNATLISGLFFVYQFMMSLILG